LTPAPLHRSRGTQGRAGRPPARRRKLRPADRAWITIAFGVVAYEAAAAASHWELLSEACDRYRGHRPILTCALVVYLAAHLTRAIPRSLDPLYLIGTASR
jgi:hypothetical protein